MTVDITMRVNINSHIIINKYSAPAFLSDPENKCAVN